MNGKDWLVQKVRHNKYSICVTILGFSCENGRMIHNIVTKMDEVKKVKWLLLFITKIFVCLSNDGISISKSSSDFYTKCIFFCVSCI